MKARVMVRGLGAIDKRTLAAQHLLAFRRELLDDLGGEPAVSAAQLALVELAVRSRLFLDHVDAHLLGQSSLLTRRNRLKPLVIERTRLADNLIAVLTRLGLERRQRPAPDLSEYVRAKYGRNENPEPNSNDIPNRPQDARSADHPGGDLADAIDRRAGAPSGDEAAPGEPPESALSPHPQSEVPA